MYLLAGGGVVNVAEQYISGERCTQEGESTLIGATYSARITTF